VSDRAEKKQPPMTVIYVVGNLLVSGPNIQLLYLISNLDRRKVKPVVLVTSFARASNGQMVFHLKQYGVEIREFACGKLLSILFMPRFLARIALKERRVILHPYGFRSDIICALSRLRPRIGTVHSNLRYNYQRRFGRWKGGLVSGINLFFLRRTDFVVSCSVSVQRDLAGLGQSSVAIRNAIDPDVYRALMCSGKVQVPTQGHPAVYVTVASVIPGKNVEFLVRQFGCLTNARRRRLLVIGHASSELVAAYRGNPNVEFRGPVERPGDVLLEAHYFVSASEHEGMPNAVLEALALGRPVVLSEIPAHREALKVVGENLGALFTWTPDSLSASLDRIEGEDYETISMKCSEAARAAFSAKTMAREYELLYGDLARTVRLPAF